MSSGSASTFAEIAAPANPFPGLRSFDLEESHLFFGRDGQSEQLISKLGRSRFVAVVGTSGSGKSSLVRAGLLPSLLGGFMVNAHSAWRIAIMRPGSDPLGNLAQALHASGAFAASGDGDAAIRTAATEATLRRGSRGLIDAVRHLGLLSNENLLVLVDQFEEIFRFGRIAESEDYANETAAFVKLILEASRQREAPIYVALTMRSDYLGDCSRFWELPEAINESQYLIPRLTRNQLREAIMGPVAVGGGMITPRLVNRLLNDVGDNQDQLPILQHALMRTWDKWKEAHEGPIDLQHYEAIGGMAGALSRHADEAFSELPDDRSREVAEKLFKALTEKGSDNREIRRPITLGELCAVTAATENAVAQVIEIFRQPHRSFLMPPAGVQLNSDSLIDISHESLIRGWRRLKEWVEEEADSARIYRRVADTAELHRQGRAGLWGDPDLQLALDWRKKNEPNEHWARRYHPGFDAAMEFLERSRENREQQVLVEQRQKRLVQRMTIALLGLSLVALAVFGWLYFEAQAQKRKTQEALDKNQEFSQELQTSDQQLKVSAGKLEAANADLLKTTGIAEKESVSAREAAERAEEEKLAAEAQLGHDLDLRAPHNLLLAVESVRITQQIGSFSPTASRQLLAAVLSAAGGLPLQHGDPVTAVGVSADDHWLATASAGNVQFWDLQAPSAKPITLTGQDREHDKVNALAFSPDGRTLATVGDDAKVRLRDTVTSDRAAGMRVLSGHRGAIVDVAFSRNGRWLATGSKDGTARLWDLAAADPATASVILPNRPDVNTLAFSADNHWLATGSSQGMVRLWDLIDANPSNSPIQRDIQTGMDVRKVAFSPDSQWLIAGDTESYKVVLLRVTAPDKQFFLRVEQWVSAVAFSPDGRWLATPSGYDARLWDLHKTDPSSEPLTLPGHKNAIIDLAFSPDGNWFATGSLDHTVQLWNVAKGFTAPAILRGHEEQITALVFSHDSRRLITGSTDRTVRLWNTSSPYAEPLALRIPDAADGSTELHLWDMRAVDSPAVSRVLKGREGKLDSGAGTVFSPDGQWVATIPAGGVDFVHLWNLSGASPTHYLVRHPGGIWASPVFSPDGRWLATGGVSDPSIRLWDLKKPDPTSSPLVLRGHRWPVRDLAFSADSRRLATGSRDDLAIVWDFTAADPSRSPKVIRGNGDIKAVAISADGRYLATGSWEPDYAARIWDLSSSVSKPIATLTFKSRVFDVAFSPDGRWFAAGSWDSTTQLLNLKKPGAKPFVLRGHSARTLSVAFSPDSQWLATGNEDQTARLWNLTAADPSADSTVLQATYKVGNVSFSPDGRWLALSQTEHRSGPFSRDGHWFASSSTNTLLYHVRLEDLILLACRTAGRNLTKSEWEQALGDRPYRKTCPQLP